jgi:hypothetical protein
VSSCAGYGWTIQQQVNIAYPLILQFIGVIFSLSAILTVSKTLVNFLSLIAGFATTALMNSTTTLTIDLFPGQSSSVIACVRRELIRELEVSLKSFIRIIFSGTI